MFIRTRDHAMENSTAGERCRCVCSAAEKQSAMPEFKELHATIGQQALEIDFLPY